MWRFSRLGLSSPSKSEDLHRSHLIKHGLIAVHPGNAPAHSCGDILCVQTSADGNGSGAVCESKSAAQVHNLCAQLTVSKSGLCAVPVGFFFFYLSGLPCPTLSSWHGQAGGRACQSPLLATLRPGWGGEQPRWPCVRVWGKR